MTITTRRRLIGVSLTLFFAAVGAGLLAEPADAGKTYAKRGEPCSPAGSVTKDRSGDWYICAQRAGDPCPVYHAKYPKPGPWPTLPAPTCPRCSASPPASTSPSVKPSRSPSATPSTSTPPATTTTHPAPSGTTGTIPGGEDGNNHPGTLPVTGPNKHVAALLAIAGTAIVVLGIAAYRAGRPRRKPYPPRPSNQEGNL